jgi:hypothetical protein
MRSTDRRWTTPQPFGRHTQVIEHVVHARAAESCNGGNPRADLGCQPVCPARVTSSVRKRTVQPAPGAHRVSTSNWWLGHDVLVAPQWIKRVSWAEQTVAADLTREALKQAPRYDAAKPFSREMEIAAQSSTGAQVIGLARHPPRFYDRVQHAAEELMPLRKVEPARS